MVRFAFIALCLCVGSNLEPSTLLYSIKLRRAFGRSESDTNDSDLVVTVVPIVATRTRHIVAQNFAVNSREESLVGGTLMNVRYNYEKKWWIEGETGIEKERIRMRGTRSLSHARTGFDDIVFSVGRDFLLKGMNERGQLVLYGLIGIPTYTKITAYDEFEAPVGTRFFNVGVGAEFSYAIIRSSEESLTGFVQARFLHLCNRKWYPILPYDAELQPGNATDLLLTLRYRNKKNTFECGYGPTFFTNQAACLSTGKVPGPSSVRQGIYASYSRALKSSPLITLPVSLFAGLSIAHDKLFDAKSGAYWIGCSITF